MSSLASAISTPLSPRRTCSRARPVSGTSAGQFRCAGDTAIGGVTDVLPYCSIPWRGAFECRSEESGMECVNLDTGHGLALNRVECRLF